jgi:hypothetical protein
MNGLLDLRSYDGKVVFVELRDGTELAGPAHAVGDGLDVFGQVIKADDVLSIDEL